MTNNSFLNQIKKIKEDSSLLNEEKREEIRKLTLEQKELSNQDKEELNEIMDGLYSPRPLTNSSTNLSIDSSANLSAEKKAIRYYEKRDTFCA
jgi:hypothetical protein